MKVTQLRDCLGRVLPRTRTPSALGLGGYPRQQAETSSRPTAGRSMRTPSSRRPELTSSQVARVLVPVTFCARARVADCVERRRLDDRPQRRPAPDRAAADGRPLGDRRDVALDALPLVRADRRGVRRHAGPPPRLARPPALGNVVHPLCGDRLRSGQTRRSVRWSEPYLRTVCVSSRSCLSGSSRRPADAETWTADAPKQVAR